MSESIQSESTPEQKAAERAAHEAAQRATRLAALEADADRDALAARAAKIVDLAVELAEDAVRVRDAERLTVDALKAEVTKLRDDNTQLWKDVYVLRGDNARLNADITAIVKQTDTGVPKRRYDSAVESYSDVAKSLAPLLLVEFARKIVNRHPVAKDDFPVISVDDFRSVRLGDLRTWLFNVGEHATVPAPTDQTDPTDVCPECHYEGRHYVRCPRLKSTTEDV